MQHAYRIIFRCAFIMQLGFALACVFSAPAAAQTESWVSDLAWTQVSNGWGPAEKDISNGETGTGDGRTQTIEGVTFAKGIGAHAYSQIDVPVNKQWRTFSSSIGIDDEVSQGSIVFVVTADGVEKYRSGTFYSDTPAESINIDITGVTTLSLIMEENGDGNAYDHGDWAGARVNQTPTLTRQAISHSFSARDFNILPASRGFIINARPGVEYAVFDLAGRTLMQGMTSRGNEMINLSGKQKGFYLVKITRANQKLVKKIILR